MSLINNKYFGRLHNCFDIWCRWTQWLDVWWVESVRSVKANVLNVEANRSKCKREKNLRLLWRGDDSGCKSVLWYGLIWQVALKIHNAFFCTTVYAEPCLLYVADDGSIHCDCVHIASGFIFHAYLFHDNFGLRFFPIFFISLSRSVSDRCRPHRFLPHFIANVVTKYENFRIKLQVKRIKRDVHTNAKRTK